MALSLGEKLRQAREERGISISEVAEQTRISPHYIESIENDNYKTLPGGIFNKGFVRSYAKFIGFDETEALSDYSKLAAENEVMAEQPLKVHRSEVLTDDTSSRSMLPTLVFAVVILGLMTAGVLFLLNYLQSPGTEVAGNKNSNSNASISTPTNTNVATPTPVSGAAPTMATVKVDFQAATDPISLLAVSDGVTTNPMVQGGGGTVSFEPKESLRVTYSKSLAGSARLFMNGKPIVLPEGPLNPRRNTIEFEINKDNVTRIWEEGRIVPALPAVTPANTNPAQTPATTPTVAPTSTPTRPPTPRPTPATSPPPVNRPSPRPTTPASTPVPRPSPN